MKRSKGISKGKKVYLKRILTAAIFIVFALSALSCAATPAKESPKDEAVKPVSESSPLNDASASVPEPSSGIKETEEPEPSPSADPYSYEELTKDIPEDFWDRFLPEIEEIKYKSIEGEDEWPFEYKGGVLALWRDVEFNPDDFEYNLRYGKQTSYQSVFEKELPLNSPVGYYLLGLENENPFIKLYCVTQMSKYIYTAYEEACVEALDKVISDMQGDDTEEGRIILDQAQKYKNFLEHKFDYKSEAFDDDYIWVSDENSEGKRFIIWSFGMIPNIVSKYVEDSLWAYDGETIWEIDAEPHFEFNCFTNSDTAHLGEHFGISAFYQFDLPFDGQWEEHLLNGDTITVQNSQGPEYSDIGWDEVLVRKIYGEEEDTMLLSDTDSAYQIILFGDKFNMDMSKTEFSDSLMSLSESNGLEAFDLNIVNETGNFDPFVGINADISDIYFVGEAELSNSKSIHFELPELFGEEPIIDIYTAPGRSILNSSPYFENDKLIRYSVLIFSGEDNQDEFNLLVKRINRELGKQYKRINSPDDIKNGDLMYKYLADSTVAYNSAFGTNLSVPQYYREIYGYEEFPGYSASIYTDIPYDYQDFFVGDEILVTVHLTGPTETIRNFLVISYYSAYDIDKMYSGGYNNGAVYSNNSDTSTFTSPSFDSDGFVFADSSSRLLTEAELSGLSKEMLGYARNEIFARHGNLFETQKYIDHYSQYDWYIELPKVQDAGYPDLNDYEIANIELIKQFEAD